METKTSEKVIVVGDCDSMQLVLGCGLPIERENNHGDEEGSEEDP